MSGFVVAQTRVVYWAKCVAQTARFAATRAPVRGRRRAHPCGPQRAHPCGPLLRCSC